ncbi:hypothetical protein FSP39_002382 [Pinctada imbricata]|uniref:Mpv17-like protein n=1 Tax=Pinctada imbricata TaxID=66713 RepID=A0AA88XHC9_PINIB|nr:hypothetical protein FSP39_002382 [Pinctada imbricata]
MTLIHTMAQYATLWAIADYMEQKYISKKPKQDWHKSFRMVTVGAFVIAPLVYGWVRVAERISPGNQLRNVLKKVFIGQTIFAPFAISTFYASTSLLEGKSVEQFKSEWSEKFPATYTNNLKVWPAVQIVNFSYVPLIHRPKVMGCVSFIWSMYLCFQKEDAYAEV